MAIPLDSDSIRVLLVEDSRASAKLAETVLGGEGYRNTFVVTHVMTLADTLLALDRDQFDIILLDLTLPDSAGLQTVAKVRARHPEIAVVVLTATDDENLGLEAVQSGAQDYLIKDETYPRLLRRTLSYSVYRFRAEKTLREGRKLAENASLAKSQFLASMSHEIRTPMNAILGFGQLLEYDKREPLTDKQLDYVQSILRSGEHLLELINGVLDFAKVEAGKEDFDLATTNISEVVSEGVDMIKPLADKRGISIEDAVSGATLPTIFVDDFRLRQVMINLLSNAVKYNRENGQIFIESSVDQNGWVEISVRDTGNGIPKDKFDAVFEAFSRLQPVDSGIEGTGIGLAFSREVVVHMGGIIDLKSEMGVGSTFSIRFPKDVDGKGAKKKKAAIGGAEVTPARSGENYKLLYVEDNPANRKLIEKIMNRVEEATYLSATNAEDGLKMATEEKPDIIIMDINLPGMDGYEALRILRTMEETKNIPVVALSADAIAEHVEKGLQAGFERYLTKPVGISEFLQAVTSSLKTARLG